MKKLALLTLLALFFTLVGCDDDDDKQISADKLPQVSKIFISTHFPDNTITYVEKDKDSYDVTLSRGFSIEFKLSGEWDDIDGNFKVLPESTLGLIPEAILEYITGNYPEDTKVTEINKETYGYEIGLTNGLNLKFNKNGEFIGIDD